MPALGAGPPATGGPDRVGDEQVGEPRVGEHLSLANGGYGQADRAQIHLAAGDLKTLVRLGMRAQRDATCAGQGGHRLQVGVHDVDIDDQTRGLDHSAIVPGGAILTMATDSAAA